MSLDADTCYRAISSRDARFDGLFFVAVTTTGIYCRPICRARTPARARCVFYLRAAEAERAGYRACFRCRPELSPGSGPVDSVPRLVQGALARIEAGALNERSIDDLAGELGVSARHLRRAVQAELGVSPVELAQSRRMALAKQLLQDTSLPMTDVAFAAGFSSVRRFNALFLDRFGRPPSALRRQAGAAGDVVVLRLDYRPPFAWAPLLDFLAARATPRVEAVREGAYLRTVRLGDRRGWIAVRPDEGRAALRAEVSLSLAGALMPLAARLRRLFDLDAHPQAVAACLGQDPALLPLLSARPGLRIPGSFDGFETAVRAILGQQVSVRAATTLAGRLAREVGDPIETPHAGLDRLGPGPAALAAAGAARLAALGVLPARAHALCALARAVTEGGLRLDPGNAGAPEATMDRLLALPGIGDWTAHYIAMRALCWPDALPAGDLALRKALGARSAPEVRARAERWRPWRAYAAVHLWTGLSTEDGT